MHDSDSNLPPGGGSGPDFSRFSTAGLAPDEGFEIWRASIAPMFDTRPVRPHEPFFGVIDAYLFEGLVLAWSRASAQHFRRDRQRQRRDGVDHFLIQHYLRGGYAGEHRAREVRVAPGDTGILDLGAETDSRDLDFECLTLVVPRDLLRPLVKGPDFGGAVLHGDSAMGRILSSHLAATWAALPGLTRGEAPFAAQALLRVLAAAIGAHMGAAADPDGSVLEQPTAVAIRAYIEQHLGRGEIDPDLLCRVFHCSRSYLYRLFADEGGVVRYIQGRRLERCYRDLTQCHGSGQRIGEIADRWGFTNASHFSRLFHEAFGRSPRAAMRGEPGPPSATAGNADLPAYRDWLLRL